MQEINYSIKNESNSLVIERDILTKSISRLYQQDPQLTKIQQDKLLTKYQYQLRVVNEKIENLESKRSQMFHQQKINHSKKWIKNYQE